MIINILLINQGYLGDVAIDEIVFTPNRRCTPVAELGELGDVVKHYCDFEFDTCGYTNDTVGTQKWYRMKPAPPLLGIITDSPAVDNTYQTRDGYYMQYRVNEALKSFLTF